MNLALAGRSPASTVSPSLSMESKTQTASPAAVAIAAILLPGLGYWLLGQPKRALLTGGGIIALFVLGLLIAGMQVISVPGFEGGNLKYLDPTIVSYKSAGADSMGVEHYLVTHRTQQGVRDEQTIRRPELQLPNAPIAAIADNLWFLGQIFVGPLCAVAGYLSIHMAQMEIGRSYGRVADVGSLYTAVAGMLNLLVIVDCISRTAPRRKKERR